MSSINAPHYIVQSEEFIHNSQPLVSAHRTSALLFDNENLAKESLEALALILGLEAHSEGIYKVTLPPNSDAVTVVRRFHIEPAYSPA